MLLNSGLSMPKFEKTARQRGFKNQSLVAKKCHFKTNLHFSDSAV